MRLLTVIFIMFISSYSFAQTQSKLNKDASESYNKADKELNKLYKKILLEYQADTMFIQNLKISQRIWISFRDAEVKMKFPEREPGYYGTIHPLCIANYMEKLTRNRIATLKLWIDGIQEGDPCSGTIKTK
ncbi:MAG: lysozyme inhibitor LprI family protein [Bacteroidota bacterium]